MDKDSPFIKKMQNKSLEDRHRAPEWGRSHMYTGVGGGGSGGYQEFERFTLCYL